MFQTNPTKFYIFLSILMVTLCGFSFFLGYKFQSVQVRTNTQDELINKTLQQIQNTSNSSSVSINSQAADIANIVWIEVGQEPVCPPSHPIKGKVDQVNYYYTPDNNFYGRVKPSLCFVNETYARDIAKFIKKY